ncbi:MAG TPA: hypothetical protein VG738_24665 [Chitinophagaceae bacterium]|nr:hypothetical protein [Chitinophagaceae bacterium]
MLTDEILLEKAKRLVENHSGWGDSDDWTNSDFIALSEKIQEQTGVSISHVTLKRLWGKVKYDSLPNTHTLDTLVQFTGYENWRSFKLKNGNGHSYLNQVEDKAVETKPAEAQPALPPKKYNGLIKKAGIAAAVIALPCILFFIPANHDKIIPAQYSFSSKTVVAQGLPNSVVFDYNAAKSPYDSVIIQQSWDKNLQVKVPRTGSQHTSIYYYPEYYHAKLIVGNQIVKQHDLLIKSDGWTPMIIHSPAPVYLDRKECIKNGILSISAAQVKAHNIPLEPDVPHVLMANVQDFGEIYSNDFTLETSLKADYKEGSAVCQVAHIYILCKESGIWIPLSAKGCVSQLDVLFTNYYKSGKQQDLSGFGVDFSKFVKVRIESKNGKANVFINDKLAYAIPGQVARTKIYGVDFQFEGAGSVDYVRLNGGKVHYDEEF